MTVDQDIASSLISVFAGLAIGVSVEAMMPSDSSASSVGELMFESSVQIALLLIVSRLFVKPSDLSIDALVPYGMALGAAQMGLLTKLTLLAAEAKKGHRALSQRMGVQFQAAPKANEATASS
jgi:hypothetical protein